VVEQLSASQEELSSTQASAISVNVLGLYMNAVYIRLVPIRYCSVLRHVSVPLNHHQEMPIQFYGNYFTHNGSVVVIG
jgi:hypothetical protein